MKSVPRSLNRLLLLTTIFFAPALAMAQEASTPPAEEGEEEEIVVLGRNIPQPMRETSEVATFLSTEDLQRQGDDTAALALTRLTGLSIVSDRFVYVRGLGDRYSSALLNGSPLPSPEPLRRQVPLDLFPSNLLDGATVQKTFSPNYPGEFGGGIIVLRTLKQPSEEFFTLKVGTGGSTESTLEKGLSYYGDRSDWTGVGGWNREIPGPLAAAMAERVPITDSNFTDVELEVMGESLVNSPFTVVQSRDLYPDLEIEATGGTSYDFGKYNIGLVGVVGYDSAFRNQIAERVTVVGDALVFDATNFKTTWDVVANALGSASVGWDGNEISLTGLIVHSTTKQAEFQDGFNPQHPGFDPENPQNTFHTESTAWYERQLTSLQLAGEHEFGDLEIDWRGAFAQSSRDAPYERDITYLLPAGVPEYQGDNSNATRFSYLTDEVLSGGVDTSYTLPLSEQRNAVFSAGYAYSNAVRDYELFSFVFTGPAVPGTPPEVLRSRPDFLFSPNHIDPLRFEIQEFTGRDDAYKARLTVSGAYAAADVEILPLVRAAVGVRWEDSTQVVRTGNRFGLTPFAAPVTIDKDYFLPAATLTWNFAEDLQLRLGYSQTIARPQFRELAFTPYLEPETGRQYSGNPGLTNSKFKNYDARLEYYFGTGRFVTLGGFYKEITNPIEEVILAGQEGTSTFTRFLNAPEAMLYGGEFEFRLTFDAPFDVLPFLADESWLLSFNYTYTKSEVTADEASTVIDPTQLPTLVRVPASRFGLDGSPLQGTPENVANLQFGFETDATQLTLLAGWVDERISRRGLGSLPTVIENPGINVDLVYRRDFQFGDSEVTFSLAGRNLLDESHEEFQNSALGRTEVNTYPRGVSYSASLTAKF